MKDYQIYQIYQINSAVTACQERIENGADIGYAFALLDEELSLIYKGEIIYED